MDESGTSDSNQGGFCRLGSREGMRFLKKNGPSRLQNLREESCKVGVGGFCRFAPGYCKVLASIKAKLRTLVKRTKGKLRTDPVLEEKDMCDSASLDHSQISVLESDGQEDDDYSPRMLNVDDVSTHRLGMEAVSPQKFMVCDERRQKLTDGDVSPQKSRVCDMSPHKFGMVDSIPGKFEVDSGSLGRRMSGPGWDPGDLVFECQLGKGAHGSVHKARLNGSTVAVKVLSKKQKSGNDESHSGFSDTAETGLINRICHAHLVEVYGVINVNEDWELDLCGGGSGMRSTFDSDMFGSTYHMEDNCSWVNTAQNFQTWVVMEYCDQGSLWDAVQMGTYCTAAISRTPNYIKIIQVALEIASGMQYLHLQGIIHGDLKAENVMLQRSETCSKKVVAKVGDFGLSRRPEAGRIDLTTFSLGTVDHMAPETLRAGKLHYATDVFSFAILLLELMTGVRPFHGMTTPAVMMAIVQGFRPKIPPTCPSPLTRLIEDCWHQDWKQRPTFDEVVTQLGSMEQLLIRDNDIFIEA